jgi:predicted AlkP superfamily phosphohydrolase/phosphomutase
MKRFLLFLAAILIVASGLWLANTRLATPPAPTPTPTAQPTNAPRPSATPVAQSHKQVVVISLDGAQADRVRGYMADGAMPNLARLASQGTMAQYAHSIDPSLTAAAHASLATGAYPSSTGVVSNRYHRSADAFNWYTDALATVALGSEPLWRTAMRQGLRTATICFPETSLDAPNSLADYTVAYGAEDAYSAQHEVTLADAQAWTNAPPSFSPLKDGSLTILKSKAPLATVYVLAVDNSDDGQANYDTFYLSRSRAIDENSARLKLGAATPLIVDANTVSGAYFTATRLEGDKLTVYQGPVTYNQIRPIELAREVTQRYRFFPAGADYYALEHNWITPAQYVHQAELQASWIISVTDYVLDTYKPDLLYTWQGAADEMQHQFLMLNPDQPNYTPERAQEYAGYVRRGYALADAAVGDLAKSLDPNLATLIVVSDHGMAPVRDQVYVNTILAQKGLVVYGAGSSFPIDNTASKAVAFASGGAAHIYINLAGRENPGIVPVQDYKAVQDAIVEALTQAKDKDGKPLFSRVVRRADLPDYALDSANSGDVFVQAAPGHVLTDYRGNPDVLGPIAYYGQHGYAADLADMHAIFLAEGRGIRTGQQTGPVHIVDLAPTVARLLDIPAQMNFAGRVLDEVLLP